MNDTATRTAAALHAGASHQHTKVSSNFQASSPLKGDWKDIRKTQTTCDSWRKSHLGPVDVQNAEPIALMKVDRMAASDAAYKPPKLDAGDVAKIKQKWQARQRKHLSAAAPLFGYRESIAQILRSDLERGVGASPGTVSAPAADYKGYIKATKAQEHGASSSRSACLSSSQSCASDSLASCDQTNVAWGNNGGKMSSPVQTARGRFTAMLKSFQSKPKSMAKTVSSAAVSSRADGLSTH